MRFIITGASEGLGYELSKLCIENNIEVIAISRKKPDLKVTHIKSDFTDNSSVENAALEIKKMGRFDALINCAGVMDDVETGKIDAKKTENLLKVNLLAPMLLTARLMDSIKEYEADVMNVTSTMAIKARENQVSYASSKWGLRGMTHNLQHELANTKCRVMNFCPGGFKSKMYENSMGKTKVLGDDWMEPAELAKLMLYLLRMPKNMQASEVVINRK